LTRGERKRAEAGCPDEDSPGPEEILRAGNDKPVERKEKRQ